MEPLAIRLSPQAGKSLVIPDGEGANESLRKFHSNGHGELPPLIMKLTMPVSLSPTLSRPAGEGANESLREFHVNDAIIPDDNRFISYSLIAIASLASRINCCGVHCAASGRLLGTSRSSCMVFPFYAS